MEKLSILQNIIDKSNNIVVLTGAGISTLSGMKDFRSDNGLYHEAYKYRPEEILSHHFFMNNTTAFYEYYKNKLNPLNYKPNIVHNYLVKLEKNNKLKAIITQNIDGLHEIAGSKNVLNLHGSSYYNHCLKCHKSYDINYVFKSNDIPLCHCGGIIKPDVVLYEEALDENTLNKAIEYIYNADTLIILGTSLEVYPAAGLINYFKGSNLVIINKDKTPYDIKANLVINEDLKEVFTRLK